MTLKVCLRGAFKGSLLQINTLKSAATTLYELGLDGEESM